MVYEALVTQQSPTLAALVKGAMSESVSGEVRWDDVDKETFLRFI